MGEGILAATQHDEVNVKTEITELINRACAMLFEISDIEKTSEEDVKVKLIFPLFRILGWDVENHREAELEFGCGYDKNIYRKLLERFSYLDNKLDSGYYPDALFRNNNEPYIFLEAKSFGCILPKPDEPIGARIIENAKNYPTLKFVVFTNFLETSIVDMASGQTIKFGSPDEYVSRYNELKVLAKPTPKNLTVVKPRLICFGSYNLNGRECDNCIPIQQLLCKSITNLQLSTNPSIKAMTK